MSIAIPQTRCSTLIVTIKFVDCGEARGGRASTT
jgi:hypothetical protein